MSPLIIYAILNTHMSEIPYKGKFLINMDYYTF